MRALSCWFSDRCAWDRVLRWRCLTGFLLCMHPSACLSFFPPRCFFSFRRQDQILLQKFNLSSCEVMFMSSFYGLLLSVFFCAVLESFSGFCHIFGQQILSPSASPASSRSWASFSTASAKDLQDTWSDRNLSSSILPSFSSLSAPGVHTPPSSNPRLITSPMTSTTSGHNNTSSLYIGEDPSSASFSLASPISSTLLSSGGYPGTAPTADGFSSSFFSFYPLSQENFLSPSDSSKYTTLAIHTPPSSSSSSSFSFCFSSVVLLPLQMLSGFLSHLLHHRSVSLSSPVSTFFLSAPLTPQSPDSSLSFLPPRPDHPPSLSTPSPLPSPADFSSLQVDAINRTTQQMNRRAGQDMADAFPLAGNRGNLTSSSPLSSEASSYLASWVSSSSSSSSSMAGSSLLGSPVGCLLLVSLGGSMSQLCGILCMKLSSAVYVSILTTVRRVLLVLVSIVFLHKGEKEEEETSLPLLARASVLSICLAGVSEDEEQTSPKSRLEGPVCVRVRMLGGEDEEVEEEEDERNLQKADVYTCFSFLGRSSLTDRKGKDERKRERKGDRSKRFLGCGAVVIYTFLPLRIEVFYG